MSTFNTFSAPCDKTWHLGGALTLAAPKHQVLPQGAEKSVESAH
ncbi:unnamed protein product, partial [Rotaria sp. Silwood1]